MISRVLIYLLSILMLVSALLIYRSEIELTKEIQLARSNSGVVAIGHYRKALSWVLPWQGHLGEQLANEAVALIGKSSVSGLERTNLIYEVKRGIDSSRFNYLPYSWRKELSDSLVKLAGVKRSALVAPFPSFVYSLLVHLSFIFFIAGGLLVCFKGFNREGKPSQECLKYAIFTLISLFVFFFSLGLV